MLGYECDIGSINISELRLPLTFKLQYVEKRLIYILTFYRGKVPLNLSGPWDFSVSVGICLLVLSISSFEKNSSKLLKFHSSN